MGALDHLISLCSPTALRRWWLTLDLREALLQLGDVELTEAVDLPALSTMDGELLAPGVVSVTIPIPVVENGTSKAYWRAPYACKPVSIGYAGDPIPASAGGTVLLDVRNVYEDVSLIVGPQNLETMTPGTSGDNNTVLDGDNEIIAELDLIEFSITTNNEDATGGPVSILFSYAPVGAASAEGGSGP